MGNKSSLSLRLAEPHAFMHNDRTLKSSYLLACGWKGVEVSMSADKAERLYLDLRYKAFVNYIKRTKQKLQTKEEKMRWSAVVNLKDSHTMKDLKKLSMVLKEKYGWQTIQLAIHRDEGYVNDDAEPVLNQHGHIELFMLDEGGIYRFKKRDFGYKKMVELQTLVAEVLEMERGRSKSETGRVRFEHHQYKQHIKEIEALKKYYEQLLKKQETEICELKKRIESEGEEAKSNENYTRRRYL